MEKAETKLVEKNYYRSALIPGTVVVVGPNPIKLDYSAAYLAS